MTKKIQYRIKGKKCGDYTKYYPQRKFWCFWVAVCAADGLWYDYSEQKARKMIADHKAGTDKFFEWIITID